MFVIYVLSMKSSNVFSQPVSVPEKDLPVFVKESDTVYRSKTHTPVACPKCGSPKAHRDPDTLDTFVDSSWYWARYPSTSNSKEIISPNDASETLPVDLYIGGNEHSILHLLYARFMGKFMTKEGILDLPHGEPFKKLLTQGMVLGKTWVDDAGRYYKEEIVDREKRVVKESGVSVDMRWEKMSKSKGNGVDPEVCVNIQRVLTLGV